MERPTALHLDCHRLVLLITFRKIRTAKAITKNHGTLSIPRRRPVSPQADEAGETPLSGAKGEEKMLIRMVGLMVLVAGIGLGKLVLDYPYPGPDAMLEQLEMFWITKLIFGPFAFVLGMSGLVLLIAGDRANEVFSRDSKG